MKFSVFSNEMSSLQKIQLIFQFDFNRIKIEVYYIPIILNTSYLEFFRLALTETRFRWMVSFLQ